MNDISNNSVYQLLSRREVQILQLIIEGNTDKEIAGKLGISFNTVRTNHQKILSKTNQHSISGLIYYARNSTNNINK